MLGFDAIGANAIGASGAAPVVTTISATVGNAVAQGLPATVISYTTTKINATVGNAVAQGLPVTVISMATTKINATVGNAVAQGLPATVTGFVTTKINALVGNAVAQGLTASVVNLPPVPSPVYPDPSMVAVGVKYGPTGVEFTGTFVGGTGSSYTIEELVSAIWSSPYAMTVAKFQALK